MLRAEDRPWPWKVFFVLSSGKLPALAIMSGEAPSVTLANAGNFTKGKYTLCAILPAKKSQREDMAVVITAKQKNNTILSILVSNDLIYL
ncbi:MAG TPA: hypothetical protein DCO75_09950 [Fibrobacteres bacterium]|jgi:hypothetical protein|nr:hypothetical protein [Fibrobacterota bacterium]